MTPSASGANPPHRYFAASLAAVLFSAFIYLHFFGLDHPLIHTLAALGSLLLFVRLERFLELFVFGFLVGIFWFWWVGLSFRYYDLGYLIPLVILFMGFTQAIIFGLLHYLKHPFLRLLALAGLGCLHPLGWNWMVPEAVFALTPLGIEKWQFVSVLVGIYLLVTLRRYQKIAGIIPLLLAVEWTTPNIPPPKLNIAISETHWQQDEKWERSNLQKVIHHNFDLIEQAIAQKKKLIILPESAFPMVLAGYPNIIDHLRNLSQKIAIITGTLDYHEGKGYNSTYLFHQGKVEIANKVVLVPFGEKIPLPSFLRTWINDLFFNGASDYFTADHPTDFLIHGTLFRNAICYEATTDVIYDHTPPYVIAISNNAWFTPSTEPALQEMLLKYYARKYDLLIHHSTNRSPAGIIDSKTAPIF